MLSPLRPRGSLTSPLFTCGVLGLLGAVTAVSVAACGGSTTATPAPAVEDASVAEPVDAGEPDTTPPVDNGAPSEVYPAPHPASPEIQSYGGPTMAAPKIVPIVWQGDTYATQIADFAKKLGPSSYWKEATAEYGVGPATAAEPIVITEAAPKSITDTEITTWLASMLDGTHPAFGTADETAIYTIYYPTGTKIEIPNFGSSCEGFGGYHYETEIQGKKIVYAVIPRCGSFFGMSGVDVLTSTSAHEFVEAATDPQAVTNPAFSIPDQDHMIYALFPLSEVGDMCTFNADSNQKLLDVGGYMIQRTWSNAAAKAGRHPCVPNLAGEVYFNTAPVLNEKVYIDFGGGQAYATKGVKIPVGKSKTIELDLFSEAATSGAWTVGAVDTSAYYRQAPELEFKFDRREGVNGEKLHMTITALKAGKYGGSEFIVTSSLGKRQNIWMGFVQN
jgi:hypothetical protein